MSKDKTHTPGFSAFSPVWPAVKFDKMPDGPIHAWIERSATVVEVIAVAIIFVVVTIGTVRYVLRIVLREADHATYTSYRFVVGRALLLGP